MKLKPLEFLSNRYYYRWAHNIDWLRVKILEEIQGQINISKYLTSQGRISQASVLGDILVGIRASNQNLRQEIVARNKKE